MTIKPWFKFFREHQDLPLQFVRSQYWVLDSQFKKYLEGTQWKCPQRLDRTIFLSGEHRDFGIKLMNARNLRGLTLNEAAQRLNASPLALQRAENGSIDPPLSFILRAMELYENAIFEHHLLPDTSDTPD
jgi:DNA-binding XRE family transcriptional regulator